MSENDVQPKELEGFKKLAFKQALIVLGHGEQIRTVPSEEWGLITFQVDENDDFIAENQGYMDLYEWSDEQWYAAQDVYEKLFEKEGQ